MTLTQFNSSTLKVSYNTATGNVQMVGFDPCASCPAGTTPYRVDCAIYNLADVCWGVLACDDPGLGDEALVATGLAEQINVDPEIYETHYSLIQSPTAACIYSAIVTLPTPVKIYYAIDPDTPPTCEDAISVYVTLTQIKITLSRSASYATLSIRPESWTGTYQGCSLSTDVSLISWRFSTTSGCFGGRSELLRTARLLDLGSYTFTEIK